MGIVNAGNRAENDFAIVRAIVRVVPLRAVNKRLRARSMSQSNHRCEALGRVVESAAYLNDVAVDRDDRFPRRDGCSSNVTINDTSAASVK